MSAQPKILIIDNSKISAQYIQTCLKLFLNLKSTSSLYAFYAKDILENETFDLVLLNWHMDMNITGFELLPLIPNSTKIILTSNWFDHYKLPTSPKELSKINDYFSKTEPPENLIKKVEKLLKK